MTISTLSRQPEIETGVHEGIEYEILQGPFCVNGYIRLPENHPWRNIDLGYANEETIEVHGGITYGMDKEGWIGFDTHHADDYTPIFPSWGGRKWTLDDVRDETFHLAEQAAEAAGKRQS